MLFGRCCFKCSAGARTVNLLCVHVFVYIFYELLSLIMFCVHISCSFVYNFSIYGPNFFFLLLLFQFLNSLVIHSKAVTFTNYLNNIPSCSLWKPKNRERGNEEWQKNVRLWNKITAAEYPLRLKVLAHGVRHFLYAFFFCFFVILSYQDACYGCENAENQTWYEFYMTDKVLEAMGKCDWHNMRSYLFFNVRKFQMKLSNPVSNGL